MMDLDVILLWPNLCVRQGKTYVVEIDQHDYVMVCLFFDSTTGLCPANERRRYKVTPSLIGWAQT